MIAEVWGENHDGRDYVVLSLLENYRVNLKFINREAAPTSCSDKQYYWTIRRDFVVVEGQKYSFGHGTVISVKSNPKKSF